MAHETTSFLYYYYYFITTFDDGVCMYLNLKSVARASNHEPRLLLLLFQLLDLLFVCGPVRSHLNLQLVEGAADLGFHIRDCAGRLRKERHQLAVFFFLSVLLLLFQAKQYRVVFFDGDVRHLLQL